jgi:DNA modification methylase
MEVEFYCNDARDVFLSPKSVDLFIAHPPYFAMMDDERYGGDQSIQIHRIKDQEEFSNATIKYINNMADALKDQGNILLIVPNFYYGIIAIADILKGTNLFIDKILVWNFGKLESYGQMQPMFNLILQIRKNRDSKYDIKGLNSLVIDQEWALSDVPKYQHLGFMGDAFPMEIADILVNAFSEEGDTVADLFAGTGTTVLSALKNNRKAIYNDASIEQMNLAKQRVYDTIGYSNDNEKDKAMTKDESVKIMLESINADNMALGLQAGLGEKDMKAQIEASQQSLGFMMSNIYDKLKEAGAFA